mgnify:CR=1 FL=1
MTGVSYITNTEGKQTHVILDLSVYGEAVRAFLEDIATIKATAQEETYTLDETTEELNKYRILSIEELKNIKFSDTNDYNEKEKEEGEEFDDLLGDSWYHV